MFKKGEMIDIPEQWECLRCRKWFIPKKYWQKFCSNTCRVRYCEENKRGICPNCGAMVRVGDLGPVKVMKRVVNEG